MAGQRDRAAHERRFFHQSAGAATRRLERSP
jgi:hypothetical protein